MNRLITPTLHDAEGKKKMQCKNTDIMKSRKRHCIRNSLYLPSINSFYFLTAAKKSGELIPSLQISWSQKGYLRWYTVLVALQLKIIPLDCYNVKHYYVMGFFTKVYLRLQSENKCPLPSFTQRLTM